LILDIFILFVLTCLVMAAAGIVYQLVGTRRDVRTSPAPGKLVESGPHRLHVYDIGEGTPAVVLEAGISATSINWRRLQHEIAKFTRVLAYDRAGLGWSEKARTARTVTQVVKELHDLLRTAGVPLPCVFVGHSFGGFAVRVYAREYPDDVAGVVLVDPLRPEEWYPLSPEQRRLITGGAFLSRWGAFLAHFGVVRFTLAKLGRGSSFIPRVIGRATATGEGLATMERVVGEVRKMPKELWPAVISHWCLPKSFLSMGGHIAALPSSVEGMIGAKPLEDVPVTLLTGAKSHSPTPPDEAQRIAAGATHIVAENSGHWIHLDEPELVLNAVREMVERVRERSTRS